MSNQYLVTWEIDIDANSPTAAAIKALEIQRNHLSTATYFTVKDMDTNEEVDVDLPEGN